MSFQLFNSGIKRLEELTSDRKLKGWHLENTYNQDEINNKEFWGITPSKHSDNQKIPLKKIIGTRHPRYCNMKWIEVLGNLKKYDRWNWDIKTFKDKYKDAELSFVKYGNNYYINGGNNRTTIAKFLGIEYLEAPTTEYFFDQELFDLIQKAKQLNFYPKFIDYQSRDSRINLILCETKLTLKNSNVLYSFIDFYETQLPYSNYKYHLIELLKGISNKKQERFFMNVNTNHFNKLKDLINHHKRLHSYGSTLLL